MGTLAERFPKSRALAPTRLRLGEAALAADQAERAAQQFRLVAGDTTLPTEPRKSPGTKSNDATEPALRVRALTGLGKALQRRRATPAAAAAAFAAVLELGASTDPAAAEASNGLTQGRALEANKQVDAEAAQVVFCLILEKFGKSKPSATSCLGAGSTPGSDRSPRSCRTCIPNAWSTIPARSRCTSVSGRHRGRRSAI